MFLRFPFAGHSARPDQVHCPSAQAQLQFTLPCCGLHWNLPVASRSQSPSGCPCTLTAGVREWVQVTDSETLSCPLPVILCGLSLCLISKKALEVSLPARQGCRTELLCSQYIKGSVAHRVTGDLWAHGGVHACLRHGLGSVPMLRSQPDWRPGGRGWVGNRFVCRAAFLAFHSVYLKHTKAQS